MSDNLKLGEVIRGEQHRDAIHIAVAPVVAAMHLEAGDRIGLDSEGKASVNATKIGIVDPFLNQPVEPGEQFWMFLNPNTVTGMRHHWSHPQFPMVSQSALDLERQASIEWLTGAAVQLGVSYDTLISDYSDLVTGDYINNGEHIRDIWYGLSEEFWKHRKIVTGVDVDENNRGGFTCSC